MRVLIVGSGGREHALSAKLAGEPGVQQVYCAPGNAGIGAVATRLAIDAGDPQAILAAAERESIDLTVVGPELPLDRGIVDLFMSRGRLIFGPSRAAAQLECDLVVLLDVGGPDVLIFKHAISSISQERKAPSETPS